MGNCMLCPRRCGADRAAGQTGICGMPDTVFVAHAAPHFYEEPPISGERGSGAVFFTGCPLGCVFCQNREISHTAKGAHPVGIAMGIEELAELFLRVANSGVHNLNLVTPTHYADKIAAALRAVKPELRIPVIYNTSGYELPETLALFEGLVDIYLPDFKYISPALSAAYSGAPDYAAVTKAALLEMFRQIGSIREEGGLLFRGLVVRHLMLPGCREDSLAVLRELAALLPVSGIYLSLMRQYTPEFAGAFAPANLRRRVTSLEYESVADEAARLGFSGFLQKKESAKADYTPRFGHIAF